MPSARDGKLVEREDRGEVTILRLNRGKANAFDIELAEALSDELRSIRNDADYRAVVLTGTGSIFSAGVDLFRLVDEDESYINHFLPALIHTFTELLSLELPVVAAVNGHAIAGGCVMASACDYRLMADGEATIGVPELRVPVPFPTVAIEILRLAAAGGHFQELVYLGKTYRVREAYERGLIDEVVPAAELLDRACSVAERLHAIPRETFGLTKRQVRQPTMRRIERWAPEIDPEVLALWKAPETVTAIRAFLKERLGR